MTTDATSALRVQLLANGYKILPNKGKIPAPAGWNTPAYVVKELMDGPKGTAAKRVASWAKRFPDAPSTGLLVVSGLVVIDLDIDDALIDAVMGAIGRIALKVFSYAPTRFGSGYKLALFCRLSATDEPFVRIASRRFNGHCVEVFGSGTRKGKATRQFGIYGPHSFNEDGSVAVEYGWHDDMPDLAHTPVEELPVVTVSEIHEIIDAFEDLATKAGWQMEVQPDADRGEAVYDITDETRFDTDRAGSNLTYEELSAALDSHYSELRCSSSFMPGREGKDTSRCWVFHSPRHDCAAVFVYGDEQTHYPIEHKPGIEAERLEEALDAIGSELDLGEPPEPDPKAELNEKALWLVQTRAYCEAEDSVVRIYATDLACHSKPAAFRRRYAAWFVRPDKRRKAEYATELWEHTPQRPSIAGVRMRPDMPFPLYEDEGALFKNTYRKPVHKAGGDVAPFERFMERFIPDATERGWLLDWMAHKQARPDIPGTAVVYVADTIDGIREGTFGTGRGLMFRIAHRLYGTQYATAQAFSILEGSNGQSVYNDWMHGSVLVTVDEAKTSPTAYRRGERSAAYEVLKDIVDPAPKKFSFKGKYRQAFVDMSFCSFWVASNHTDAFAIPEHDRRFTVLRNGRAVTPDEAAEIAAWMEVPANIGALAAALARRDLSGFDMYAPLVTAGKAEMAELARSDVEELLRDMMDSERGLVFTKQHIEASIEHNFSGQGSFWRGEFKAAWSQYCVGLKGHGGSPRRLRIHGTQRKLFCFRTNKARVDHMPEAAIRREASKWGGVDPMEDLGEAAGLGQNSY